MSNKNLQNQEPENNGDSYVYTVSTDTDKDKRFDNEGIIKKLLRKILTWQGIAAIVAIITLGYVIWDHIGPDSKTILNKNNAELISQINSTFITDINPVESDTLGEIERIIKFRTEAKEFCSLYESLKKTKLNSNNIMFENALESYIFKMIRQNDLAKEMSKNFTTLCSLAKQYNIEEYQYFDYSLHDEMIKTSKAKTDLTAKALQDIIKCQRTKDLDKALEIAQDMYNDYIWLKADNAWLNYAVEANRIMELRLKKIKSSN